MQSEPHSRLHPLSLPFRFLSHLRGFLLPLFILVAFSEDSNWEAWSILILVPIMIYETWAYMNLRFWINSGELVVKEGVFFREERHIPLDRIQTIDSTQNLAQRLFGVVEVTVETAGSSKPEAHLKVLSIAARDQLRANIFGAERPVYAGPERRSEVRDDGYEEVMWVKPQELALLGLNLWRGVAILVIAFGVGGQLKLFDGKLVEQLFNTVRGQAEQLSDSGVGVEILAMLCLAVALTLLTFSLSVASVWIKLFGFRLLRKGSEFRTECGLFTRHATTIPKARVQFISVQAPLSLRIFGRCLIKVRTAGGQGKNDKALATRNWLTPVIREVDVPALIAELLPGYSPAELQWQGLAKGAAWRMYFKALVLTALVALLPLSGLGWFSLPTLIPAAGSLFFGLAHQRARRFAWALTPNALLVRDGVLTQRTAIIPRDRVQCVALRADPFDRRWQMSSILVDTAGGGIGHNAALPYINSGVARDLALTLTPHSA